MPVNKETQTPTTGQSVPGSNFNEVIHHTLKNLSLASVVSYPRYTFLELLPFCYGYSQCNQSQIDRVTKFDDLSLIYTSPHWSYSFLVVNINTAFRQYYSQILFMRLCQSVTFREFPPEIILQRIMLDILIRYIVSINSLSLITSNDLTCVFSSIELEPEGLSKTS